MKGNQGLEALAALAGVRPAVDMADGGAPPSAAATSAANGTGTAPSTPSRTSPQASAVTSPTTTKMVAPAGIASASNQILLGQASAPISGGNGTAAAVQKQIQQQQAAAAGIAPAMDASAAPGVATIGGLTPQQISQALAAAGGRLDPSLAQSLLYPAALRGATGSVEAVAASTPVPAVPASTNNILANTMQQLVLQQYLQAQANAQQQQVQQHQQAQAQAAATAAATSGHPQAALLAMTLAAGKTGQLLPAAAPNPTMGANTTTAGGQQASAGAQQQQQAQVAQAQALLQHAAQQQQQINAAGFTAIKPAKTGMHQHAQAIQQQYHFQNGAPVAAGAAATLPSMMKIAAAGGRILPSTELSPQNPLAAKTASGDSPGSKKQQKRAANRRSAQLSRKRKKQFIEELKEENDDLRRKEQILRAIPDLIVVFDSSGRLGFVSESVNRFLDVEPGKLEGTSFWDLICEESVRMLKAAFMDSLAAREVNSDTAMLGSGVWELRLKDKNSKYIIVTLNGVVHFKGDAPECVCCIRPFGEEKKKRQKEQQIEDSKQSPQLKSEGLESSDNAESGDSDDKPGKSVNRAVSCSDGDASRSSDGSNRTQQSVLNSRHVGLSTLSAEQDEAAIDAKKRSKKFRRVMASADDGDSSSSNNSNNNVEADGTNNSVRISDGDSNDGIESD